MRLASLALALLLLGAPRAAVAEPAAAAQQEIVRPPPDPRQGERFDGLPKKRRRARQDLLYIPRAILILPRFIIAGILAPVGAMVRWNERHHLMQRIADALTSRDGLVGVRPLFNFVSSFRAIAGLAYFNRRLAGRGSEFQLSIQGNVANALYAHLSLRPMSDRAPIQTTFAADYFSRQDYLFTGIGFESARVNPAARYRIDSFDLTHHMAVHLHHYVSLHVSGDFGLRRFGNGIETYGDRPIFEVYCPKLNDRCLSPDVDEKQVPGFHSGTQFMRAGAGLRVDTRDLTTLPSAGAVLEVMGDYSHGLGSDRSSYFRVYGSLVASFDLWHRSRTLVVRLSAGTLANIGDVPVPFSELFTLGGPEGNRGLRWAKYRDASYLLASIEYRWPLWMWLDAALFVDYGGVFQPHWDGFAFDKMIPSVGLALRARTTKRFFVRFQVGYGINEGWNASIVTTPGP